MGVVNSGKLVIVVEFEIMDPSCRVLGSLLGLAVCDAVGTTVEFMPPGSFDPVKDMEGGGKFNLLPGEVAS